MHVNKHCMFTFIYASLLSVCMTTLVPIQAKPAVGTPMFNRTSFCSSRCLLINGAVCSVGMSTSMQCLIFKIFCLSVAYHNLPAQYDPFLRKKPCNMYRTLEGATSLVHTKSLLHTNQPTSVTAASSLFNQGSPSSWHLSKIMRDSSLHA